MFNQFINKLQKIANPIANAKFQVQISQSVKTL